MTDDKYPACFNSNKQYRAWKKLALDSGLRSMSICVDCTLEYQTAMLAAGRCHSPDANVVLLQLREKENDIRQERMEVKASEVEALNDMWIRMVDQLTYVPPPPKKQTRRKKPDERPT